MVLIIRRPNQLIDNPLAEQDDPFNAGRVWEKHYAMTMENIPSVMKDALTEGELEVLPLQSEQNKCFTVRSRYADAVKSLIAKGLVREVTVLCK